MQNNNLQFLVMNEEEFNRNFYTLNDHPLGQGTYSIVYLIIQRQLWQQYYALKKPRDNIQSHNSIINEILVLNQIQINAQGETPQCIPQVFAIIDNNKIIMEYMNSGSLYEQIKICGKYTEKMARKIGKVLLMSIAQLHNLNVVHFDLKPENILFNEQLILKICDYGYANNPVGFTPGYASPEQVQNNINNDNRNKCDIFSYGVILFVLVMGIPPFQYYGDEWFKMISENNWNKFWSILQEHLQFQPSEQFKYLISNLLNINSNNRFSFQQISISQWFQLDIATDQDYIIELKRRKNLLQTGYYRQ